MKNKFFLAICLIFFFSFCSEKSVVILNDTISIDKYKLRDDTILTDPVLHSKFSRLTKAQSFGVNGAYKIPTEFRHKALRIIYQCRIRTNQVYTNSAVAIGVTEKDKVLFWKALSLRFAYTDVNAWCWYKDSMDVGPTKEAKEAVDVSAYLDNTQIEKFDMDSLLITIKCKL